jgi:hypothetical protein
MANIGEKELITNFVLKNEDNLRIALKIVSAYDEIQREIVSNFSQELTKALREELNKEWEITNELTNKEWRYFSITKKKWNKGYVIGFETHPHPSLRNFYFAVIRHKQKFPKPVDKGILKKKLDEYIKGWPEVGPEDINYEWWQYVRKDYLNWDEEEFFVKLHNKEKSILDYFKGNLLTIKGIIEPIIDKALTLKK